MPAVRVIRSPFPPTMKTTSSKIRQLAILMLAGAAVALAPTLRADDAAPVASEYKKGLWLNIWTYRNKSLEGDFPTWGEVGSIALTKQPFSPGAVKDDPDYKNYYSQPFFFGLEGWLKITKAGEHTLAVDVENTNSNNPNGIWVKKYSIYMEDNCLVRSKDKNPLYPSNPTISISADAILEPGMYRVRIPFDMSSSDNIINRYSDIKITFRLKEPGSRRARVLTEEDLYHKE
jgi:hypothetical protein